ncbi:hypothetical protein ACFOET_20145 [Parapedobacter deserti]|uniref:Uncharacterized protein n=1 Tax=Parapedobacter deserti TaxID=1912957 RepID=A0ABV7JS41_9SPHI
MENQEHKKPSDPETRERGIAENERANYSSASADKHKTHDEDEDSDIRETDDVRETDTGGSDLAGTASGNLEPDDLPNKDE